MATTKTATDDLQGQVLDTIRKSRGIVDGLRKLFQAASSSAQDRHWPGADRYLPAGCSTPPTTSPSSCSRRSAAAHKAIEVTTPIYERIEEQGAKAAKSVRADLTPERRSPGRKRPRTRASSCFRRC